MATLYGVIILFALVFGSFDAASVDPKELLWPLPQEFNFSTAPVPVESTNFKFMGDGPGGHSTILQTVFARYLELLFDSGNSTGTGGISSMTVTVASADETLGMDTSEKCEFPGETFMKIAVLSSMIHVITRDYTLFRVYWVLDV